jgi:transcriptional regulator with XRE-family HTH domain
MTSPSENNSPRHSDSIDYTIARVRDGAFDAVMRLWRRRQAAGLQQKDLAEKAEMSPAQINRALRGPRNWTLRTFAQFVYALDGEAEIRVCGLDEPAESKTNFHAYDGYRLKGTFEIEKRDDGTKLRAIMTAGTTANRP